MYKFPSTVSARIGSRVLLNDNTYRELREVALDMETSAPVPPVYVWSYDDKAKKTSPNQKDYEDFMGGSSATSSRSRSASSNVKKMQQYVCACCGKDFRLQQASMEGAHILELQEMEGLDSPTKRKRY